ncbi:hypothetical protein TNCV_649951 [Trichonephila clavipes]|nr:hypothetical protein TNCV_649951 [Trichonephila clavipes]
MTPGGSGEMLFTLREETNKNPEAPKSNAYSTPILGVIGSTRNVPSDARCPSVRLFTMVREDIGARSEGAPYVWTAANKAVGSTHVCPNTASQSYQNGLFDELATQLPSSRRFFPSRTLAAAHIVFDG